MEELCGLLTKCLEFYVLSLALYLKLNGTRWSKGAIVVQDKVHGIKEDLVMVFGQGNMKTPPKVLPTKQWKPTGRLLPLRRQCPLVRSTALKSNCLPADPQETITPVAYNLACTNQPDSNYNWGSNARLPPDFVSEPIYAEFMPQEDDVLLAKEQPLPIAASPTAQSPGYVPESDPEEDPDEDDEDPEEDPANYLTDRDDDDEEEEEPSVDDANDEEDKEEDEEEDHPAPADSVSPPLVYRVTARMSIRPRHRHRISIDPRYEVGESSSAPTAGPTRGFRVDYGFITIMDREIRRDPERDVGYGITYTWDEMLVDMPGAPATDDTELGRWMIEFAFMETIDQGIVAALAARDAYRNMNGEDSHNPGTGVRRMEQVTRALTWCNSHVRTVGHDVTYAMTWADLNKKMTDEYCPRNKMKKLEAELWNLKVKESDKIERYVGGLPDMIYGSVALSKPKTTQEAIKMATELMDKKIRTFVERQTETKWKQDDNQQQQQNKWQNTCRAYTAGTGEKRQYGGSKSLCSKCNYHHDDPCAPKCYKCNKVGHLAHDCRSMTNANNANNQRGTGTGQKPTCYECEA
ncbi:reverse transcriptase domain-containing protein [Tanacetum coccineum]